MLEVADPENCMGVGCVVLARFALCSEGGDLQSPGPRQVGFHGMYLQECMCAGYPALTMFIRVYCGRRAGAKAWLEEPCP